MGGVLIRGRHASVRIIDSESHLVQNLLGNGIEGHLIPCQFLRRVADVLGGVLDSSAHTLEL